jgi:signal transduction histidine kinase
MDTTVLNKEAVPASDRSFVQGASSESGTAKAGDHRDDAIVLVDPDGLVLQHGAAFPGLIGAAGSYVGLRLPMVGVAPLMLEELVVKACFFPCIFNRADHRTATLLVHAERFPVAGQEALLLCIRQNKDGARSSKLPTGEALELARMMGLTATSTALAHELNQPLTALILYIQSLQRLIKVTPDASGLAQARELSGKAAREAQRASDIIKRVRTLAQRREPMRSLVNFESIVDEAAETALAGRRGAPDLKRDFGEVGAVRVDAVQIQQVVVNLIANACDALAGNSLGAIALQTRRLPDRIELSVRDNGPGVPPHAMDQLFRAFATTKVGGIGLGLSISQAIAQGHGGDLTIDPYQPGQGAVFRLSLPIETSSGETSRAKAGENPNDRPPIGQEKTK